MKESITSRVSRIISGSARKLIDIIESAAPEIVMEEAINEIDSAIYDVRSELGKVSASKHLATNRLSEANKKHDDLSEKIELAIKESREDLAEAAVSQQLDIEVQIPVLEQSIVESQEKIIELEGYVSALQAKKREMREELRSFSKIKAESKSISGLDTKLGQNEIEQRVMIAEAAFDRIMEKTTGLPGRDSSDVKTAAQLEELEDLSRKNRIKERLESIKVKMKNDD
jgi:phage shock protein A